MYPKGFDTKVRVDAMANHLCGISRPGHFEGVATICLKLFQITQADIAVFGEKDFQQLRILQRMATDLNLPLRIQPHSTVREKDGLALSSRNRYLSTDERRWAAHIPRALDLVVEKAKSQPETRVGELIDLAGAELSRVPLQVEYLSLASEWDLVPISRDTRVSAIESPHFFLAVRAGQTRLIDNRTLASGRDPK
jgi:pantoate--beta-alanine ligase